MRDFLLTNYMWLKALHVIAVIAWMAGMLYLPRLFVYHHQSQKGGEAEKQLVVMERRLLKAIINPSIIAVWLFAGLMIYANPALMSDHWFQVKLAAVLGISALHGTFASAQRKFERGERPYSEKTWRVINEGPTILMIIAVVMVVVRPF